MSMALQAKLLRALQEREVERVGTSKSVKINTRVIAAATRTCRSSCARDDSAKTSSTG